MFHTPEKVKPAPQYDSLNGCPVAGYRICGASLCWDFGFLWEAMAELSNGSHCDGSH